MEDPLPQNLPSNSEVPALQQRKHIYITIIIITFVILIIGEVTLAKPFNIFQPKISPTPTTMPLNYGIAGKVYESTSSAEKENKFQKYKITLSNTPDQTMEVRSYESTAEAQSKQNKFKTSTEKFKKTQIKAFSEIYPGIDLSKLIQISGTVLEVETSSQSLKISSENTSGWIKISTNWHGNTLTKDLRNGVYMQKETINIPKGAWGKMVGLLRQSTKVLLLCTDSTCAESIGGHIYLD